MPHNFPRYNRSLFQRWDSSGSKQKLPFSFFSSNLFHFVPYLSCLLCFLATEERKPAEVLVVEGHQYAVVGWVAHFSLKPAFLFSLGVNCKFWITMLKTIKYLREILWFFFSFIFHCSVVFFTHQGLHWCHRKALIFSCKRKWMNQPKAHVVTAWYHSYHPGACCLFLLYSFLGV